MLSDRIRCDDVHIRLDHDHCCRLDHDHRSVDDDRSLIDHANRR
jgi:hypothetical protein